MSGHSKFANIKHKKEKNDAARGKIFTMLGREIAVAVKEGGPDPNNNGKLRDVIAKAKASNMPNDTIERGIKKAAGDVNSVSFVTVTYEGYGPGGIAILVRALTNNRNRTAADVRHIFSKNGGSLGVDGSVSFLFEEKGIILISKEDYEDEDAVMMDALDCGAENCEAEDEVYEIETTPDSYYEVKDALEAKGYAFLDSSLGPVATTTNEVTDEAIVAQLEKMLEMFEENDDVQEVYHNWDN